MQQPANAITTTDGRAWVVVPNPALPGKFITVDFQDGFEIRRQPSTFRDIAQFELRQPWTQ